MTDEQIAEIAGKLTEAQKRALLWLDEKPKSWPKGSEVSLYALSKWCKGDPTKQPVIYGILCQQAGRAEPKTGRIWGDTLWVITPLGLAVRNHLENSRGTD